MQSLIALFCPGRAGDRARDRQHRPVANFIERNPTMKMLALAFCILIGVPLVAEGFHPPIEGGYVYFAMAFSLIVELLNIRMRARTRPLDHERSA